MADELRSIVLAMAPSAVVARHLASGLVTERLAACVSIVPEVTSIYTWDEQVEQAEETLMVIKRRRSSYAASKSPHTGANTTVGRRPRSAGNPCNRAAARRGMVYSLR